MANEEMVHCVRHSVCDTGSFRDRTIDFADDFYLVPEDVKLFFRDSVRPALITSCDFTNCYYVPTKILASAIEKCCNVRTLRLLNSSVNLTQLAKILVKCNKVERLALNVATKEFWTKDFLDEKKFEILPEVPRGCPWERLFRLCVLRECLDTWRNLIQLELDLVPDSVILGTVLR